MILVISSQKKLKKNKDNHVLWQSAAIRLQRKRHICEERDEAGVVISHVTDKIK